MTYLVRDTVPLDVPVHHNYNKNYWIVVFVSFGVVVAAAVGAVDYDEDFVGADSVRVVIAETET